MLSSQVRQRYVVVLNLSNQVYALSRRRELTLELGVRQGDQCFVRAPSIELTFRSVQAEFCDDELRVGARSRHRAFQPSHDLVTPCLLAAVEWQAMIDLPPREA